jgi:group I intron endonuclease
MAYVYTLEHVESGKIYIGSTNDIVTRKRSHFYTLKLGKHVNTDLQKAYDQSPEFKVTVHEMPDIETARQTEASLIQLLRESGTLLNRTGVVDVIWTEEMRQALSAKKTGIPKTLEARARMSISKMGIGHTDTTRKKMSETRTGMKQSAEWIENRAAKKRKPVLVDDIEYESLTTVAKTYGIGLQTAADRIRSQTALFKGWRYK